MEKVLVIDDDEILRGVLADWLIAEGFQPITAENGLIGVQLAKQQQPRVILCDVRMPVMNGYEVLRELRNHPHTVHIPFFFVTSEIEPNHRASMSHSIADGWVKKPIGIDQLRQILAVR